MEIFPAIDLSGGQAVRLTQGDYNRMTVYNADPLKQAAEFKQAGACYLHVVDLDGAKDGEMTNFSVIKELAEKSGLMIEVGGGIRNEERIRAYLDLGVWRVILGTVAVKDPEFVRAMAAKYGDKIVVGVDAKDGKVAVNGWLEETELETAEFCRELAAVGVKTVIVTDIAKDGLLGGTNLELYRELVRLEGLEVVASGGVSFPEEIDKLAEIGVSGVIVGKALYTGRLDLSDLLRRAERAGGAK